MDGETRVGPLSYDVTTADTSLDPERPMLIGGLAAGGLLLLSLVAGWFTLGFVANRNLVNRGFPVVVLLVPLALAYVTSRGVRPLQRRKAMLVVLGIAVVAAVFSNRTIGTIKPALPQVRASIESVKLPAGFRLIDEETRGDRFCRRGCPRVFRRYTSPAGDPDPVSTFVLAMERAGWEPPAGMDPAKTTVLSQGDLGAQVQEKEGRIVEVVVQRRG